MVRWSFKYDIRALVRFNNIEHFSFGCGDNTADNLFRSFRKEISPAKSPSLETMTALLNFSSYASRTAYSTKSASQFPFGLPSPPYTTSLKTKVKPDSCR